MTHKQDYEALLDNLKAIPSGKVRPPALPVSEEAQDAMLSFPWRGMTGPLWKPRGLTGLWLSLCLKEREHCGKLRPSGFYRVKNVSKNGNCIIHKLVKLLKFIHKVSLHLLP